jgi:hypothetical protein
LIKVKIVTAGLGNQMFSYAFAKSLENKGFDVGIDISGFNPNTWWGGYHLDQFLINIKILNKKSEFLFKINRILNRILNQLQLKNPNIIIEKSLAFDPKLLSPNDNKYMMGYFQSEKYFKEIRGNLIKEFTPRNLSEYSKKIKNLIKSRNNTCSIHIRRGDFMTEINKSIYITCGLPYYKLAVKKIEEITGKQQFFIFSDDIEWAKENLQIQNSKFIDSDIKRSPVEDVYLMSLCDNNIIVNSTFSWWGAWLNDNSRKKVISPKKWFLDNDLNKKNNIVCKDWITL